MSNAVFWAIFMGLVPASFWLGRATSSQPIPRCLIQGLIGFIAAFIAAFLVVYLRTR